MKKRDYYSYFKKDSKGHSSNKLKSVWENVTIPMKGWILILLLISYVIPD